MEMSVFYNNFGPEVLAQKQIREFTYFYKVSTDFYLNFLKIEAINFLGQRSQTHISILDLQKCKMICYLCMYVWSFGPIFNGRIVVKHFDLESRLNSTI